MDGPFQQSPEDVAAWELEEWWGAFSVAGVGRARERPGEIRVQNHENARKSAQCLDFAPRHKKSPGRTSCAGLWQAIKACATCRCRQAIKAGATFR